MTLKTDVFITDPADFGFDAQCMAMAASIRSRSKLSMRELVKKVKEQGPDKFMKTYYIGYGSNGEAGSLPGHGSICQSGSFTVELEGVSMLAALAFEDHGLFNGQESSTRYLDYSGRDYVVPFGLSAVDTKECDSIINEWFNLYDLVYKEHLAKLKSENKCPEGEDPSVFEKALECAAFDKASGYLPAAAKTNVSWHTQIDNANTQVQRLKFFPLNEVRVRAGEVEEAMLARYPNSTKVAVPEGHAEFMRKYAIDINYSEISVQLANAPDRDIAMSQQGEIILSSSLYTQDSKETYASNWIISQNIEELLMNRPKYFYPPAMLKGTGYVQLNATLDLASFRDLHRHRDGFIPLPFLDARFGLHSWYSKDVSSTVQVALMDKVENLLQRISQIQRRNPFEAQYLMPLALRVPVEMNWQLPQAIYVSELRSGHACREPLRILAQLVGNHLLEVFPNMKLYHNCEPEKPFYFERGKQDIYKVNKDGSLTSLSDECKEVEEVVDSGLNLSSAVLFGASDSE